MKLEAMVVQGLDLLSRHSLGRLKEVFLQRHVDVLHLTDEVR